MFFKERKEKLRVQIDKKFKEDAEMKMIDEKEEDSGGDDDSSTPKEEENKEESTV